ncbi:MAG: 2-amino-4-hydroxy-6-hydroxymethyldihydropteridine diphosphokinase [Rhizobiales bacterium]|nr:2-amino-4-hydroxy-6-hydroxymethyldihydropteridine diphosphokinase [Hyphomicrobiales bacterium]
MILIGLGSNVEGPWGSPEDTVRTALNRLDGAKTKLVKASRPLSSKPVGPIEQDDYINAAAIIETSLQPEQLMQHLHDLELQSARHRTVRWGPRTLDLDLLDYDGLVHHGQGQAEGCQKSLILPHPEIAKRSFVLAPVAEIAPDWRHPLTRKTAAELLAELDERPDAYHFI